MTESDTGYMQRFANIYWKRECSRKRIIVQSIDGFMFLYSWQKLSSLFDNFYTSVELLKALYTRCSSLWHRSYKSQMAPKELLPKQLKLNNHELRRMTVLNFVFGRTGTSCAKNVKWLSRKHERSVPK